jgi:creatinine amidohydrolase
MSVHRWADLDRAALRDLLAEAVVLLPLGATEQHGPHLPTGTDFLISSVVTARAADSASGGARDLIIGPAIAVGASDHHLPFGGTVSLSAATMLSVLDDVISSMVASGAHRIVLVNGHGGNTGICHAAAAAASARLDVSVAHIDYWRLLAPQADVAAVPGHAGQFETSVVLALQPDLVRARAVRQDPPAYPAPAGVDVHSAAHWASIDGYTDHPESATADLGVRLLDDIVAALAQRLIELGESL